MRNTSILTRVLALVLSVVLVLTGMSMAVFAEEIAKPTELEQPEETATATEDGVEEVPVTEEEQPAEEEVPAEGEAPALDDSQLPADVVDELVPSDDPVEEAPEDLPTDDGEQVELPDQEEFPEENADEIPPVEDEIIVEDEPADDMPEEEELYFEDEIATEPEEITEDEHPVKVMLEASGYAYVMTDDASKELPLGKYELVEIKAPEGYFFDPAPIPVDLAYANDHTAVVELRVEVGNDCLPAKISLMKEIDELRTISSGKNGVKSILNAAPGEGFVFGLFRTHDMPYAYGTLMADTLVATGATDRNGMLTFEGIYPHGDYYVKELQAKAGWKMSADRYDLSITPDRKASDENVLRVILVDPIHNDLVHGRVTLTKTDITGEKTLPGAVIEVYNDKGEVVYRDTTDESGRIASIPVTPGRYTFREIYAPDGYALNDAIMSFSVDSDGVVTGTTTIRDDYTRFSVAKCDENEAPLSGVEFSLIRSDGSTLMTARTNRSGIATFEKVPYGSYRIVETRPLAGYLPAEMDVQVNVDGTFLNPEEPLAVIVNVPNEVLIQKVDQDGKPLSGAEFALIDAFGDRFAVATSDANGQVRFHKVPYGSYTIRELKAPDGHLASKEEITLKVDADFRSTGTPMATVVNHQKRVKFIKVDTSGNFLPGVEFSLLNAVTYEVVETVTSNEKGEFLFTQFDYGDWIIRETAAPDGYSRMEDYLLHVGADWTEPDPITLINIPSTYMFFKSDNRRNALAGVTFVVEDEKQQFMTIKELMKTENVTEELKASDPMRWTGLMNSLKAQAEEILLAELVNS